MEISQEVWNAYDNLVKRGYNKFVLTDKNERNILRLDK